MRSGQERRSKPPRAHRPSSFPPAPLSQPSLGDGGGGGGGEERVTDALIELEEHSFRLPLTLPSERHVKSSILPPPPEGPSFEEDERALRALRDHDGSLQPADDTRDEDEEESARERERVRLARQASMQRWALLVTAPLAIVAIAAIVRATVIWGRTPALEVNAANVANVTTATAAPVLASAPPIPPPPQAPVPEPPSPAPKAAPPEAAPIVVTAEEQIARDGAAAKKEKFEAQAALEVGDGRRAQRAAKRATTLDPSDAHGWLLLVAAELDCKNPVAANEALRSCLTVATRGPRGECIGMVTGRAARAKKTMDVKTLSSIEPPDVPNGSESSLPATPPPAPTR